VERTPRVTGWWFDTASRGSVSSSPLYLHLEVKQDVPGTLGIVRSDRFEPKQTSKVFKVREANNWTDFYHLDRLSASATVELKHVYWYAFLGEEI